MPAAARSSGVFSTTGRRVRSITSPGPPGIRAIGSMCMRSPCSYSYRKRIRPLSGSNQRMPMLSVARTSRSLSPTRSTMPWKLSSAAIPCWMLLITASSALRCSVSLSRRCVSANRRAFSSATAMLAARVCSKRTSDSSNASSRSKSESAIRPRTSPPATIGTSSADFSTDCDPAMTKLPKRSIAPGTSRLTKSVSPVRKTCGPKPRLASVRWTGSMPRRAPRSSV